jgi:hypothetical protein
MTRQVARVDEDRPAVVSERGRRTHLDLIRWAAFARYGERVVYYRGELGKLPHELIEQGHHVSQKGLVFLNHRKLDDGRYAYEATRITEGTARILRDLQEALRPRDRRLAA